MSRLKIITYLQRISLVLAVCCLFLLTIESFILSHENASISPALNAEVVLDEAPTPEVATRKAEETATDASDLSES